MSDLDYETAVKYELNRFKEAVEEIIQAKVKADFDDRYREYVNNVDTIREQINSHAHDIDYIQSEIIDSCDELDNLSLPWE